MEEFFKKYNKIIGFSITNTIVLLIGLLFLNRIGFIDISILLPLKYYWLIILYLVSFFGFNYYQGCTNKNKEKIERISKYVFLFLLFLITLNILNFIIKSPSRVIFTFNNFSFYLNHIFLLLGVCLLVFSKDDLNEVSIEKKYDKRFDWYKIGFFLVIILYLAIQLSMFQFRGGYPDEFRHILAAKNLSQEGNFPIINNYFGEKGYIRGAPISYIIAFLYSLFGFSIDLAKIAPIGLGLINLFLLKDIADFLINDKKFRIVALLLFICSSWLIFIHFYIRHYVFLEFSFVLTIFLLSKLINHFTNKKKVVFYIFALAITALVNYFFMNDSTKYIIPFVSIISLTSLFIYSSDYIKSKLYNFIFKSSFLKFFLFLVITLILLFLFLKSTNLLALIENLIDGETNTKENHYNFFTFFFGQYSFFSIFLLYTIPSIIKKRNYKNLLFLPFFSLMIFHMISSESMQIMRGMVYLLPIYFIFVSYGLEKILSTFTDKRIRLFIFILFIISFISIMYHDSQLIFASGYPQFPREIGYDEYQPMYGYIVNNLNDYKIVTTEYTSQREVLYNFKSDFSVTFKNNIECNYASSYKDNQNICREYYTNTPQITTRSVFYDLISKKKNCLILRNFADHFLEDSDIRRIKKNFELKESFIGYDIYCND